MSDLQKDRETLVQADNAVKSLSKLLRVSPNDVVGSVEKLVTDIESLKSKLKEIEDDRRSTEK